MLLVSIAGVGGAIGVAQSLEIIDEWWTLLILRDSFLGVRRFDDFVDRLGISRNILTNRLDKLVAAGILERRTYDEGRGRHDYVLTDKGRALWPVLALRPRTGRAVRSGQARPRRRLTARSPIHVAAARAVVWEWASVGSAR